MNCNNHKHCNPVTLVDGSMSCTWSAEWMAECLAREVLRIPRRYERQQWLELYEKKHGTASAGKLKSLILEVHKARNG